MLELYDCSCCCFYVLYFLICDVFLGGASSSGAGSSTRNLWVSGLSSNTKAADLKNLFGKYGKVGALLVQLCRSSSKTTAGLIVVNFYKL